MYEPIWTNGTVTVTLFSIAVFIAASAGSVLLLSLAVKRHQVDSAIALLPISLAFGVFFGHFLFAFTRVLIYPLDYETPVAFLMNPAVGGFMYLGVFGGAALSAFIISHLHRISFTELMKILLPALLLALAIIRFAEPLDGQGKGPEAAGGFFPFSFAPEAEYPEDRYIPVFFYEGIYALGLAIWSMRNALGKSKKHHPTMFFFILYLSGQMFFEVFRQDEYINVTSLITFIRLNQLFAAILLGIYLIYTAAKSRKYIKTKSLILRCAVFVVSVGACVGLQFLFDKPLPFFGQTIWFADWFVYLLLALSAIGMGWPIISLLNRIPSSDSGSGMY